MKKNKMLRFASVLMVLTLLSTSIVGSTFAKYVTKGSANDTARVAKWGVAITASGSLFSDAYAKATGNTPTAWNADSIANGDITVATTEADQGKNIVAPGTQSYGNGLNFGITGTPEVRTKVKVDVNAQDIYLGAGSYAVMQAVTVKEATFAEKRTSGLYTENNGAYAKVDESATFDSTKTYYELSNQVTLDAAYYPVTYTGTDTGSTLAGKTKATEIAEAIVKKADSAAADTNTSAAKAELTATKEYAPNTDIAETLKLDNNTITWAWKYFTGSDTDTVGKDLEDTILGDLMAGSPAVVAVGTNGAVTVLTVDGNGLVKAGNDEVGSVVTALDIAITATQVD